MNLGVAKYSMLTDPISCISPQKVFWFYTMMRLNKFAVKTAILGTKHTLRKLCSHGRSQRSCGPRGMQS